MAEFSDQGIRFRLLPGSLQACGQPDAHARRLRNGRAIRLLVDGERIAQQRNGLGEFPILVKRPAQSGFDSVE